MKERTAPGHEIESATNGPSVTLKSLKLDNLLSFGRATQPVELGRLNVLIGPNGSGKSNFIEAIGLLKAAPGDLLEPIRLGGGVAEWIWKGANDAPATIDAVVAYPAGAAGPTGPVGLHHHLAFRQVGQQLRVADERIADAGPDSPAEHAYFRHLPGQAALLGVKDAPHARELTPRPEQSILSQRSDPDLYPQLNHLAVTYASFRLFRDWRFGRTSPLRRPQPADMPNEYLVEDASNLGLVLNRLRQNVPVKRAILEWLHDIFEGADDFDVSVAGGTVQVFLQEGDFTTPATRLSDGTMRWLALLAVLLDPAPPPLVCIEEPDLGLHPDLVGTLAKLLVSASERMQIVVTTHSDTLVDALSERPEAVIVCERHDGATVMRRLDRGDLGEWLERYSLGQLWSKGHLGGNRW